MYHLIITVEKDGKEIFESEKELVFEFTKIGKEIQCALFTPKDDETLVFKAIDEANDYLNSNPELWIADVPVNDDDTDPQGDK